MLVKFKDTVKDVALSEVNAENFIVKKGEERYYHVKLTKVEFSSKGVDLSKTFIKKFAARVYESPIGASIRKEWDKCEVLHNPKEWLDKKAEAEATRKSELNAQAKAKADADAQEAREALKAEMKAELKAEMEAELKAKTKKEETKKEETK